jgi:hypothetical protein
VKGANGVSALEVAFQQLQEAAKSLRSAFRKREDRGEFRDLALTRADPPGAFLSCCRCHFSGEIRETFL